MTPATRRAAPFIAVGTAFLGLGLAGRRSFVFVGGVLIILGILMLRGRR